MTELIEVPQVALAELRRRFGVDLLYESLAGLQVRRGRCRRDLDPVSSVARPPSYLEVTSRPELWEGLGGASSRDNSISRYF
jgi:hypothetical protein